MRNADDSDETSEARTDAMHVAGCLAGLSAIGAVSNNPSWPGAVVPSVAMLMVVVVCLFILRK